MQCALASPILPSEGAAHHQKCDTTKEESDFLPERVACLAIGDRVNSHIIRGSCMEVITMTQVLSGGSSSPIDASAEVRTVGQFPRAVREIENVWIQLADGCRLAARVWLPEDADRDPVPAILEYLPYRKRDFTAARDELSHTYFAGHGYACVRVDLRGS
jgi:X-Pro dipeptidyl-peptidase (S15 family)